MSAETKVMELGQAVEKLIRPGDSLALGLALEGFVPFAVTHEIIRRGIDGLTLIGPISNVCFDQMIGAGLVDRIIAAWVGNVTTGMGYNFRRAVEQAEPKPLKVINHSNFSISLALEAAARGVGMAVSRTLLGSDIAKDNPHFKPFKCPHSGQKLLAVKAVKPDVALVHVQKADAQGNCQSWGAQGITRQAAMAAEKVLVTCEEIVDSGVIKKDPDRTVVPGMLVQAVCEVPFGAHPATVQGYYDLDNQMFLDYAACTKDRQGALDWLDEWVYGVSGREDYLAKLAPSRRAGLLVGHPAPGERVEYGW